jgi:hypothetical protein
MEDLMRIGTRLMVAGLGAAAALTLAAGTAGAVTTAAAPAAATTLSHHAATSGIKVNPAATGWLRNFTSFDSKAACELSGSFYMYTYVDGGVVTNYDCVFNGVAWELDLYISPLVCPNVTREPGFSGRLTPARCE